MFASVSELTSDALYIIKNVTGRRLIMHDEI